MVKVSVSKHFEYEASYQLPAVFLLIYTFILIAYDQYYYISERHTK